MYVNPKLNFSLTCLKNRRHVIEEQNRGRICLCCQVKYPKECEILKKYITTKISQFFGKLNIFFRLGPCDSCFILE